MEAITGVVIPLMIAGLSALISRHIARSATKNTLQDKVAEGTSVFNNIGYRYFGAIAMAYDHSTGNALDDPHVWKVYRMIMTDIVEDIRWLRTNPIYAEIVEETTNLPFLQNHLVAEAEGSEAGASPMVLRLMCEMFLESDRWQVSDDADGTVADVQAFARRLCGQVSRIQ